MTKYSGDVASLFSHLDIQQLTNYINWLKLSDLKIIHAVVLPQINDLEKRKKIKQLLNERETQIYTADTEYAIAQEMDSPDTVVDRLQNAYKALTKEALLILKNDEIRRMVLKNASQDELFVLDKKLKELKDPELASIQKAFDEANQGFEISQRKAQEWLKQHKNLQWNTKIWKSLVTKINKANAEIQSRPVVPPLEVAPKVKNSIFSTFGDRVKTVVGGVVVGTVSFLGWVITTPFKSFAKTFSFFWDKITPSRGKEQGLGSWITLNAFTAVVSLIPTVATVGLTTVYNYLTPIGKSIRNGFSAIYGNSKKKEMPYENKIDKNEDQQLKIMDKLGAAEISKITALSVVGEQRTRLPEQIKEGIMTRFGMVAASAVVAGTHQDDEHHSSIKSVMGSLLVEGDTNVEKNRILRALQTVNPPSSSPFRIKNGDHAFGIGGQAELVTSFERDMMRRLVQSPQSYEQYGLRFSKEEVEQLSNYHKNQIRSQKMINIMQHVCAMEGGYKKVPGQESYLKVPEPYFSRKEGPYRKKLALAGKELQKECAELKDGEALYLETGLEGHAMQLVIKREGGQFKLSTYDSSGALENTVQKSSLAGVIQLSQMSSSAMRKNALSFKIPVDRLNSADGLAYLTDLIHSNSTAGCGETHVEGNVRHTTMEERDQMGDDLLGKVRQLLALNDQAYVYQRYIKRFSSLASKESPAEFEELLQRPQNTGNCYAKKIQSNELYELGKSTYKKVRLAMLLDQRAALLSDVCGDKKGEQPFVDSEYLPMLKGLEPEYLSPSELYDVSMRLTEINEPPSSDYYQKYFTSLLDLKEKLGNLPDNRDNQVTIKRMNKKIASHAKELYLYLKSSGKTDEIKEYFIPEVYTDKDFDWNGRLMPLIENDEGKIEPTILKLLSEHSAALSWKASFQLLNHQIQKLNVNERYIHSPAQRLDNVSHWRVSGKITLKDLENANIISFVTGFARKEDTTVEINVGRTRKEIDKTTFFRLVVTNKEALTNPKVMGLLDALRNSTPEMEKRYVKEVYPAQRQAFIEKLQTNIEETALAIQTTIQRLENGHQKIVDLMSQCQSNIDLLTIEIAKERALSGESNRSVKLKNLEARKILLGKEIEELNALKVSAENKILSLSANNPAKAKAILEKLKENDPDLRTMNAVTRAFKEGLNELDEVDKQLKSRIREFESDDIEKQSNSRLHELGKYREKIISNYLETNQDYRILDELSLGLMGGDKQKNRDIFTQDLEKREAFKQGKVNFAPGSVFQEIQSLNQVLKSQITGVIERRILFKTDTYGPNSMDTMGSGNTVYAAIDAQAKAITTEPLSPEVKEDWMKKMFAIWLKHENKEKLYKLEMHHDKEIAIKEEFYNFLQKTANIKFATLKETGVPVDMTASKLGWKTISESEMVTHRLTEKEAAITLQRRFKAFMSAKPNSIPVQREKIDLSVKLTSVDLVAKHDSTAKVPEFDVPAGIVFVLLYENAVIDGSTLDFLRDNPTPVPPGEDGPTIDQCNTYFQQIGEYLGKLKGFQGLENKNQRITEFCHSAASNIFNLPFPPTAQLATALSTAMLSFYKDEKGSYDAAFLKLENAQRAQILTNLIKLNLSQIPTNPDGPTKVESKFYSTIKHWERLINPADVAMSERIKILEPCGLISVDTTIIQLVDSAVHYSPIGLEGIFEGQKGLQIALIEFGRKRKEAAAIKNGDPDAVEEEEPLAGLRKLADRLGMRNGGKILAHQFIKYYDEKTLFSPEGLNSTTGRELFARAFLDAFVNASPADKEQLLITIESIDFYPEQSDTCKMSITHEEFLEEMLLRASVLDPEAFKGSDDATPREIAPVKIQERVREWTDSNQTDGKLRLFGFAKEINLLTLQIENAKKNNFPQSTRDELCSQLICANLAYQLMYEQTPEDTLIAIGKNFEMTRELALAQANVNKLQHDIVDFSTKLSEPGKAQSFEKHFSAFANASKFNQMMVCLQGKPTSSAIPGFISLGGINSLDTLHGAIYIGPNKMGYMPAHIQSNIALEILSLNRLPFKPFQNGYIYTEDKKIKASITPQADGSLIIQRELKSIDGREVMLQYIPPEKIVEMLPISLRRRVSADHFFIDKEGAIHAFAADFTPILKVTKEHGVWSGKLLDKNNSITPIVLNNELGIVLKLSQVFSAGELVAVDKDTVYLPSIAKYVIKDETSDNYFIADSKTDFSSRKHFEITPEGSAVTKKVLTEAEVNEVHELEIKIVTLESQKDGITKLDLVSKQSKENIETSIKKCKAKICEIQDAENLLFVGDSPKIQELEKKYTQLRTEMLKAYSAFKAGGKDRNKLAAKYNETKDAFFQVKEDLQRAYGTTNYLRVYQNKDGILKAKDFQSILHIGSIEGKTKILIHMLGGNFPTAPLEKTELDELHKLQKAYENPTTKDESLARVMLLGTEIQHHLLERSAAATGKAPSWDRTAYEKAISDFESAVTAANETIPHQQFSEVWRAIQSEFITKEIVNQAFSKPVTELPVLIHQPVNINTKTNDMPIETMGGRTLVQFQVFDNPSSLIDKEQLELAKRLRTLAGFEESVEAQEDGYYYENLGLFNNKTLEKLFSINAEHPGIEGLVTTNVEDLIELMKEKNWIKPVAGIPGKFQLTQHPSAFFSQPSIGAFLADRGFNKQSIKLVSDRLETFLYQTAFCSGSYSFVADRQVELIQQLSDSIKRSNSEFLEAEDKIESTLAPATTKITMAELNAAYLLNDYREILSKYPPDQQKHVQIVLNNAMTRMLYYKTEVDHLNDVKSTFEMGQESKAISMLYVKRQYPLDRLLTSESILNKQSIEKEIAAEEQDQKMQRAFLLFESEFGHRCNTRQVNVFRGLLLEDETNPDKIDSAQARMGFGKTTLLPLVALFKTGGDKLIRFVVHKSALETNTADMSGTLVNVVGRRAVKDDFQRYSIALSDPKADMETESPRLKSLQSAKQDLQKRLALYKRIIANQEILVQSPSVRNSMECQAKIFLNQLVRISENPTATEKMQNKELMECISLLNEIRSITTVSIFDELDATQDSATTDVNYTSGNKLPIDPKEIYPLELITETIREAADKSPANLAELLLDKFNIQGEDRVSIQKYILSRKEKKPESVTFNNRTQVYLMRAILTDPKGMLSLFTEKEAGKNFGVWFQTASDGTRKYDMDALRTGGETQAKNPLLITVPYSSANQPKPKGSRFDNPEVTAVTTFLYYMNEETEINAVPHFEFLIESFKSGSGNKPYMDTIGEKVEPEFEALFNIVEKIASTPELVSRNAQRDEMFAKAVKLPAFRKMLARTIVQDQIKFDAGKANSNRYEQGTKKDSVIGFSGTAGDTSSHFKENMLDPAADGNMTLGIMARKENQRTHILDTTVLSEETDNTAALISKLAGTFGTKTRALIDVGGLCKIANRTVAKKLALQLKASSDSELRKLEGVIFYDDVTNMKKVLVVDAHGKETIKDLTPDLVTKSDKGGTFFTYYDQSHSRGADIKQMNGAEAVLTVSKTLDNNDYKQAIMRMRKIIDRNLKQSFSLAIPDVVREQIITELGLSDEHELTGNDIAFWLREHELKNDPNQIPILTAELDSIVKNAILQQQSDITNLLPRDNLTPEKIKIFKDCISELDAISKFISESSVDLKSKYGGTECTIKKGAFISYVTTRFDDRMKAIFTAVNKARNGLALAEVAETEKKPYYTMQERIVKRRSARLPEEVTIPGVEGADSLSETHSEAENQSHSQSETQTHSHSQTQTHAFSDVKNEEVIVEVRINKASITISPASIEYLLLSEQIVALPKAHDVKNMKHLFNDDDPIKCSHSYKDDNITITPPVRYFLARDGEYPNVILLSQDEANAFLSANPEITGWSLYDIRDLESAGLPPVHGPAVNALEGTLLDKLKFASYRYEVKGKTVHALANSLGGLYTVEQLQPKLEITFAKTKNFSEENPVFKMSSWGFDGADQHTIQMGIKPIDVNPNDLNRKSGMAITMEVLAKKPVVGLRKGKEEDLTRAEIFISDTLKDRITPEAKPKLTKIAAEICENHEKVMAERKRIRKEIRDIKLAKAEKHQEFEGKIEYGPDIDPTSGKPIAIKGKIKDLELQIAAHVRAAKEKMAEQFPESAKDMLNMRKKHQEIIDKQIRNMCARRGDDEEEYGIRVDGTMHENLGAACIHVMNTLFQQHRTKSMTIAKMREKLDEYIEMVTEAVETRYEECIPFNGKKGTLMDFLYEEATKDQFIDEDNNTLNEEIDFEGKTLEEFLANHLQDLDIYDDYNFPSEPERTRKKWAPFIEHIKCEILLGRKEKNLTKEAFIEKMNSRIKRIIRAANDNEEHAEYKIADEKEFVAQLMQRLTISTNSEEDEEENISALKKNIRNVVSEKLLQATMNPSSTDRKEKNFFVGLNGEMESKLGKPDYELPPELLDFDKAPFKEEDIRPAIIKALKNQNIEVSKKEIDKMTADAVSFLNGRKAAQKMLDNYKAKGKRGREIYVGGPNGERGKGAVLNKDFKIIRRLDAAVLPLQIQLEKAKAQYKADMKLLEERHVYIRTHAKANDKAAEEAQSEMSAITKITHGIKKLFQIFLNNHVKLETTEPIDTSMRNEVKDTNARRVLEDTQALEFMDTHFDLITIVGNKAAAEVALTFFPPEYDEVVKDMAAQAEQLHGLELGIEERCGDVFITSHTDVVKPAAKKIQPRENEVSGLRPKFEVDQEMARERKLHEAQERHKQLDRTWDDDLEEDVFVESSDSEAHIDTSPHRLEVDEVVNEGRVEIDKITAPSLVTETPPKEVDAPVFLVGDSPLVSLDKGASQENTIQISKNVKVEMMRLRGEQMREEIAASATSVVKSQ